MNWTTPSAAQAALAPPESKTEGEITMAMFGLFKKKEKPEEENFKHHMVKYRHLFL